MATMIPVSISALHNLFADILRSSHQLAGALNELL